VNAPENIFEHIPPHSIEAEQLVIGLMVANESARHEAMQSLRALDFYRPVHQDLFAAFVKMTEAKTEIDLPSLMRETAATWEGVNEAERDGLEMSNGESYVIHCMGVGAFALGTTPHIATIRKHALRRQVISQCIGIIGTVQNEEDVDPVELITEKALALDRRDASGLRTAEEVVSLVWDRFDAYAQGTAKRGIPFGIDYLDHLTYGACPGDFILVAGRPSDGKTVLVTQLFVNAAKAGLRPLMFSAEMSAEEIVERALVMEARVDGGAVRAGQIESEDWSRLGTACNTLHTSAFWIDDLPASTTKIASVVKRAALQHNIGLIVVDYIQLIEWPGRAENRNVEVGNITRALKRLARTTNIPIVAACQLGRGMLKREDKRPNLGDLRESGNLEAEADKVVMIYSPNRRSYTDTPDESKPERIQAQLIVEKHRGGPTGAVSVWFTPTQTRFDSCAEPWLEPPTYAKSRKREYTPWGGEES
jgi:replicative DNA helicase